MGMKEEWQLFAKLLKDSASFLKQVHVIQGKVCNISKLTNTGSKSTSVMGLVGLFMSVLTYRLNSSTPSNVSRGHSSDYIAKALEASLVRAISRNSKF